MKIKKGEKIAELGNESENGNWPPHLHFQLIKNMEGKEGDFPGVCFKYEIKKYANQCPDPNLILGLH